MVRRVGETSSVTIESVAVQVTYEEIPLDQIVLDPNNPRLRELVKARPKPPSPKELRELILKLNGVDEHRRSIRDNGGLVEPIYVWNDGRVDNRVAEGNCRAAIYMDLKEHHKAACWNKIPAYRLPPTTTPRQVAVLQGTFHVMGKTTWGALEKAAHLSFMHTELKLDAETIARVLGWSVKAVEHEMLVYDTMHKSHLPPDKFSHFDEFFKIRKLTEYREDPANVREFVGLVASGALPNGRDVRKFAEITVNTKAMAALKLGKQDGLKKALEVVGHDDPAVESSVFRAIKKTTEKLKKLTRSDMEKIRKQPKKQEAILELVAALNEVAAQSGFKLK